MAPSDQSLTDRFATCLEACTLDRLRIPLATYTAAFLAAAPALVTAPDRRSRLAAAVAELAASGILRLSRGLDRTEQPPLPRFLVLLTRIADPPVGPEAARFAWRPELVWARTLPIRRSEFEALRKIQAFLRDRGRETEIVPVGERSLEIFRDEKKLEVLRKNRRLFAPGRLSLDLLKARWHAPPFAYCKVGNGPVAMAVENVATYHSILETLPGTSPVGLVIWGAGMHFGASIAYLAELREEGEAARIRHVRYFGDLDLVGLQIPAAADRAGRDLGLPPVLPAASLWTQLVQHGTQSADAPVDPGMAAQAVAWLPLPLRQDAALILVNGRRAAQESVGTAWLGKNTKWATWEGLGQAP